MKKSVRKKNGHITLPEEFWKIPNYLLTLFEKSIFENDLQTTLDLVAILAWKANVKRSVISRKLTRSSAGRFIRTLDRSISDWEKKYRKIPEEHRVYLYAKLFECVSENAYIHMSKQLFEGLRKEMKLTAS